LHDSGIFRSSAQALDDGLDRSCVGDERTGEECAPAQVPTRAPSAGVTMSVLWDVWESEDSYSQQANIGHNAEVVRAHLLVADVVKCSVWGRNTKMRHSRSSLKMRPLSFSEVELVRNQETYVRR
jgi:hypothetical protein